MDFKLIRQSAVYIFVSSVVLVSFVGILSIWEVFSEEVFEKSLLTLMVISVGFVLIVLTTLEREKRFIFKRQSKEGLSILRILGYLILAYIAFNVFVTLVFSLLRF